MLKRSFFVLSMMVLALSFFVPQGASAAVRKQAQVQKDYDYELIDQQPRGILTMQTGEIKRVWIEVKNTGTKTWMGDGVNSVKLGSGSRYYGAPYHDQDYASELYDANSWSSPNRATEEFGYGIRDANGGIILPPGYHTRFTFDIKAPLTPGSYLSYFTPVVEGITWMKDVGIFYWINVKENIDGVEKTIINEGETKKVAVGSIVNLITPAGEGGVSFFTNYPIAEYMWTGNICDNPRPGMNWICDSPITKQNNYFEALEEGYSRISIRNHSANIVIGRDYYEYGDNSANIYRDLFGAKKGDIIIVKLSNPGDGGYSFNEPEFPNGRVKLLDHEYFGATSGLMGDFGSDQWAFELLDGDAGNYIQIRASQPWVGGDSYTSFLLNINPILPCLGDNDLGCLAS